MFTSPSVTAEGTAVAASRSSRKRKPAVCIEISDDDDKSYRIASTPKRRKWAGKNDVIDLTADDNAAKITKSPKKKAKTGKDQDEEKRLRPHRSRPPKTYLQIKDRALSQRLTVLSRERTGTDDYPEEKVIMAGSTGNVYTQHIKRIPSCDCPHAIKGNQCKHIIYVMLRVLKAPEQTAIQLALTSSELRVLFKNAAPIPNADGDDDGQDTAATNGYRKFIEGECPICYMDFEPGKEAIVYCKAACGNNVHKDCMQKWLAVKSGKATCPYCRAQWEDDIDVGGLSGKVDLKGASRSEEGYVNIAGQLGLSGERDYSSYHQPWVRNQFDGRHRYGRRF